MIRKINFKQPKYIFPLVVFIPLCALVYFVMQTFGGSEDAQQTVATDRINTELPQANAEEAGDKMYEMSRRFGDEDAFTAIGAIGEEQKKAEEADYTTKWMIRIGVYTGARLNEVAQLHKDDIQITEDGIVALRIDDKHPDQRLKTRAARRVIPLGFPEADRKSVV